ncbi:hypothetical protein NBRC116494_08630 [Aurantivibrio plasticivorans]
MLMLAISWRSLICQICVSGLLFADVAMAAVDPSQLWLPRNYYRYKKALNQAVEVGEATERCRYVIAGTISQGRSKPDHPVFKITCRDKQRQTFAWLIDGLSMEIINRPPPPNSEELAKQRRMKEYESYWEICSAQIELRTGQMRGVTREVSGMPEAKEQGKDVVFDVRFNAAGTSGSTLKYLGVCRFAGDEKHIDIHPWKATDKDATEETDNNSSGAGVPDL